MASRRDNLRKSFAVSIRPLLTACSGEDVQKAFSTLNGDQKVGLHRLFIQVLKSLHGNIEEEFTYLCQEVKVGETLDTVEQLIEEWSLDTLLGDKYANLVLYFSYVPLTDLAQKYVPLRDGD